MRHALAAVLGLVLLTPALGAASAGDNPIDTDPIDVDFDPGNGDAPVGVRTPDGRIIELPPEVAHDETIEVTNDGVVYSEPAPYGPFRTHKYLDAAAAASGEMSAESPAAADAFTLHSRPGADLTIYLDFDGHTTSGTPWNGGGEFTSLPYSRDADSNFDTTELEYIGRIWELVAEDFAPFDVDVTTQDPGDDRLERTNYADTQYGNRVVISPTNDWYGNSGGVAYINSFTWLASLTPSFVFTGALANGYWKYVAEAASHEVGHTLGLYHDGGPSTSYYRGHGSGLNGWAPTMGVGYYEKVTQWSKGEYAGATETQDDVAILTSKLGLGGSGGAAQVVAHDETVTGVIEQGGASADFEIALGAGSATISVTPTLADNNLLAEMQLLLGTDLIAQRSPASASSWNLTVTDDLAAGTYTVRVTSIGWLTANDGFTDYASIGEFVLAVDGVDPGGGPTTTSTTSTSSTSTSSTSTTTTTTTTTTVPATTTTDPDVGRTTTTTAPPTTTTTTTLPPTTTTTTTTTTPPTTTTTTAPPTTTTTTTTVPPTTVPPPTTTTPPPPDDPAGDLLTAINPQRLLDTRIGVGGATRMAAGSTIRLGVASHPSVPANSTAAVLNVVAVNPASTGYLEVTPCTGIAETRTASVNFIGGRTVGNSTIAKLDASGDVCLYAHATTDVVVDVGGWLGPDGAGGLQPRTPQRVVDTRLGLGIPSRLAAAQTRRVDLSAAVPNGTQAVAVNLTAVTPSLDGYVVAYPCASGRTTTSSLNYGAFTTRGNNAIVALGADASFCVYTSSPTDVVIDLTGQFESDGLRYIAATPTRLLDTRDGSLRLPSGTGVSFETPAAPEGTTAAASVVVTAVDQSIEGFVTSWDCGPRPLTAALTAIGFEANTNGAVAAINGFDRSCLYVSTAANLVVDFSGWWV